MCLLTDVSGFRVRGNGIKNMCQGERKKNHMHLFSTSLVSVVKGLMDGIEVRQSQPYASRAQPFSNIFVSYTCQRRSVFEVSRLLAHP